MIKGIYVVLYIAIVAILSMPLYLFVCIVGIFDKKKKAWYSQKIVSAIFKILIFTIGVKIEASGMEKVPRDEPVLFISNHRGFADIVAVYTTCPITVGFVSKKEVKKVPCLRTWMKFLNCLFLDRENIKEGLKTILQGIENIKNGYSMIIMPEGTRSKEEGVLPFKKGSFKMAEKTKCKIVPVAISNSDEVLEKHMPKVKACTVTIQYGDAIDYANLSKEEQKTIATDVRDVIIKMLDNIKNQA